MSEELKSYFVVVYDKPGTLSIRLKCKESHLNNVKTLVANKLVTFGGALANEHVAEGLPPVIGSTMVVRNTSAEAVREWLRGDIYAKEGVWDVDGAIVNAIIVTPISS